MEMHFSASSTLFQLLLTLQLSFIVTILCYTLHIVTYIQATAKAPINETSPKEFITDLIGMCLLALFEALDVFTLLDDVLTYPHFFINNTHLFNAVLAFTSITILLLSVRGMGQQFKVVILFASNFPFLVIRIVIFDLFSNFVFHDSSTVQRRAVFIFFIGKEVLIMLLGVAQSIAVLLADRRKLCARGLYLIRRDAANQLKRLRKQFPH